MKGFFQLALERFRLWQCFIGSASLRHDLCFPAQWRLYPVSYYSCHSTCSKLVQAASSAGLARNVHYHYGFSAPPFMT